MGKFIAEQTVKQMIAADRTVKGGKVALLGLSFKENHIVNQVLFLDDKLKWRKLLDKKVEELKKSSNFGSQNKLILGKIKDILEQINADDTSRIIRGHLNIIFWDQEIKNLNTIASRIKTEFKELDIVPYYPRGAERKNYILNSFCCFSSNFSDEDLVPLLESV